jgi:hypothetical protein
VTETDDYEPAVADALVQAAGLKSPVKISAELAELLKPNDFLTGLGIQYPERLKTVLGIVKANLVPNHGGPKETLPDTGVVIPLTIAKGPYIREEPISIRAAFTDDGGRKAILLTAILDSE